MSLTCHDFNDLLLDLAYDELAPETVAKARDHAAGCPDCRAALEGIHITRKLAAHLPEPSREHSWESSILDLAAETAAAVRESEVSIDAERMSDASFDRQVGLVRREPGFFDKLRAMLLRPAFATAAAALVLFVISFGIYRFADLTPSSKSVELEGAPFSGPSSLLTDEAPAQAQAEAAASEFAAPPSPAPMLASRETEKSLGGVAGLGTAGPAPRPKNSAEELYDEQFAGGAKAKRSADKYELAADVEADALATGALGTGGAQSAKAAKASAPVSDSEALFLDGMDAYNRGDCSTAIEAFRRIVDSPGAASARAPAALHHMGRCEKRSGHCAKALLYLENLLDSYPAYRDRPAAAWEAVSCHRKLGHTSRAVQLLEELKANPEWAARAARELQVLQTPTANN